MKSMSAVIILLSLGLGASPVKAEGLVPIGVLDREAGVIRSHFTVALIKDRRIHGSLNVSVDVNLDKGISKRLVKIGLRRLKARFTKLLTKYGCRQADFSNSGNKAEIALILQALADTSFGRGHSRVHVRTARFEPRRPPKRRRII